MAVHVIRRDLVRRLLRVSLNTVGSFPGARSADGTAVVVWLRLSGGTVGLGCSCLGWGYQRETWGSQMAIAAPVIVEEMNEWVALGGTNSGIVGDDDHNYGFHRAANEVPASDY